MFSLIARSFNDMVPWYTDEQFDVDMFSAANSIALAWFFSPDRRRRIRGFLSSMTAEDHARSAAFLAALLGGRNAADSLALAKAKFRSISFKDLESSDFKNSKESSSEVNRLFDKTVPTSIGGCDAFISHSWSDNWQKKFDALQQWAGDFHVKNGRHPQLWLDKARATTLPTKTTTTTRKRLRFVGVVVL